MDSYEGCNKRNALHRVGWGLHPLKGRELKGHFSVWVSGNWRMTFIFVGADAVIIDYQDNY